MDILSWILTLTLASGQLIRLPYLTGGITALDITVALLSLLGLFKLRFKLKKPFFLIPALIFIFIALLSLLLTPLHLTYTQYLTSFSYIARFFMYVLFSWLIFGGAFPQIQKNLLKILLFAGIILAVLGLLQLIFFPDLRFLEVVGWDPHYFRAVSTFLDPNFAGAFLVLTVILILTLRKTKLSILFFCLVYLALLTTFSRGSYLMFLVSGVTVSYLKKSKMLFLLTVILFLILMGGFKLYSQTVAEPRNIDRTQSASFRLNTWQQGITLFQKYPVLGVGFNAYRYGIKQLNLGDSKFLNSHGSSGNDSSLLFVASTTGIIGLLAYLYFLFSLIKNSNKIIPVAILGLIIHSIFANSLFYPSILAWILFTCAASKK